MEVPTSKKTERPPKMANHIRNIKFLNPPLVAVSISNKEKGGPLERTPNLEEPSFITITHLKIKTIYTCCNTTDTLYL
jgi:hypothetical protein